MTLEYPSPVPTRTRRTLRVLSEVLFIDRPGFTVITVPTLRDVTEERVYVISISSTTLQKQVNRMVDIVETQSKIINRKESNTKNVQTIKK